MGRTLFGNFTFGFKMDPNHDCAEEIRKQQRADSNRLLRGNTIPELNEQKCQWKKQNFYNNDIVPPANEKRPGRKRRQFYDFLSFTLSSSSSEELAEGWEMISRNVNPAQPTEIYCEGAIKVKILSSTAFRNSIAGPDPMCTRKRWGGGGEQTHSGGNRMMSWSWADALWRWGADVKLL